MPARPQAREDKAETGPHEFVLLNGTDTHLGWISGDVAGGPDDDDQRRTAQAFTLPAIPVGPSLSWRIEHLLLEGFDPLAGDTNEFINFEIFTRTALDVGGHRRGFFRVRRNRRGQDETSLELGRAGVP